MTLEMLIELVKLHRKDFEDLRTKVEALRHEFYTMRAQIYALGIVAVIFGFAGAFGYNAFTESKKQLDELRTEVGKAREDAAKIQKELAAIDSTVKAKVESALVDAIKKNNVGARVETLETRITNFGTITTPKTAGLVGPTGGPQHATRCPAGETVIGVAINTGGTCKGSCDDNKDGRPVVGQEIICAKL